MPRGLAAGSAGLGVLTEGRVTGNVSFMRDLVLAGRGAIITGGSKGLGLAIAEAFVEAGAHVMICARSGADLQSARDLLAGRAQAGQVIAAEVADVSDAADAERLVTAAAAAFPGIDILVNNAAIVGPIGRTEDLDWSAWRQAIEINLLGAVLMCRAAVPHMRRRGRGKILQISAGGATSPDPRFSAYAASKAGLVAFSATLAEELREDRIDVNSIAPGGLATGMNDKKLEAGATNLGRAVYDQLLERKRDGGTSLRLGAELAVLLASSATDGLSGKLISAAWDDWKSLPDRIEALMHSDVFTLRRIRPQDRGLN